MILVRRAPLPVLAAALAAQAAAALAAQTAGSLDPTFFMQDPKTIMVLCADKARAARPDDSRMLADFGRIYLAAGEKGRALEAFRRASDRGPRDATTQILIAKAWLAHGARTEAFAAADRAAELAPRNKDLFAQLGVAFLDAGCGDKAKGFMDRAYGLEPTDWEMSVAFGRACLRSNSPEAAAVWFRHALAGRGEADQVYKAVGLAYADNGGRP